MHPMPTESIEARRVLGRRTPVPCELFLRGDSPHIRQVVTGFYELAAAGLVSLRVLGEPRGESTEWRDPLSFRAVIDGRRVLCDASDGWYIPPELVPYLGRAEFYFKRALDPRRLDEVPTSVRVSPLGLNYLVTSRRNLWHRGLSPLEPRRLARSVARSASVLAGRFGFRDVREMYIPDFETRPEADAAPQVLFMCRAWPASVAVETDYLRTDREAVNEMRASCIRAARVEFGARFFGGFAVDEFAQREYGDCLLPDHRASERHAFLSRVRTSAVCVATTGLHGSIGWKMAEYVAASRAIVSEPLRYQVPGGFAAGRNFIEFDSLDAFIDSVDRVLRDASLRESMRRANWEYYQRWVRPDAQVLRMLEQVVGELGRRDHEGST
jgi:hypothetical protein